MFTFHSTYGEDDGSTGVGVEETGGLGVDVGGLGLDDGGGGVEVGGCQGMSAYNSLWEWLRSHGQRTLGVEVGGLGVELGAEGGYKVV
jgi:hypothetical protein